MTPKPYLLVVVAIAMNGHCWQDLTLDESREKSAEDYDCSVDNQCDFDQNNINNDLPKKKNTFTEMLSQLNPKSELLPYFHTTPVSCLCGMRYHPKDLGRAYHPRYILSGVCSSDTCGGNSRCHPTRHYTVYVLRRKDVGPPQDANIAMVPESLRKAWVFESVRVTVGCECKL